MNCCFTFWGNNYCWRTIIDLTYSNVCTEQWPNFQLTVAILKPLYPNQICLFSYSILMSGYWSWFFVLSASALGLFSSVRLDDRKDIQTVESAWSILHVEFNKTCILPFLEKNNKGHKTNIYPHIHTQSELFLSSFLWYVHSNKNSKKPRRNQHPIVRHGLASWFFFKFLFDHKMPKMILAKYGYLSISNCHLPNKVPIYSS